jgi:plasmid stabilization system protein ParE
VKYEVVVTPEAQNGIRGAFRYIQERAPLNAERWLTGLYKQIDTLESFPERCSYAREREFFGGNLRQLL